jgi:X-X-X-Leu-X-X-Gly heptad repeat protein
MADELKPNGDHETGGQRLDRIERALNLMLDDHIQFREEHKLLLSAQVQMYGGMQELRGGLNELRGGLSELRGGLNELRGGLDELRGEMTTLTRQVGELVNQVDLMRKDFDQRLKRLEA